MFDGGFPYKTFSPVLFILYFVFLLPIFLFYWDLPKDILHRTVVCLSLYVRFALFFIVCRRAVSPFLSVYTSRDYVNPMKHNPTVKRPLSNLSAFDSVLCLERDTLEVNYNRLLI